MASSRLLYRQSPYLGEEEVEDRRDSCRASQDEVGIADEVEEAAADLGQADVADEEGKHAESGVERCVDGSTRAHGGRESM